MEEAFAGNFDHIRHAMMVRADQAVLVIDASQWNDIHIDETG